MEAIEASDGFAALVAAVCHEEEADEDDDLEAEQLALVMLARKSEAAQAAASLRIDLDSVGDIPTPISVAPQGEALVGQQPADVDVLAVDEVAPDVDQCSVDVQPLGTEGSSTAAEEHEGLGFYARWPRYADEELEEADWMADPLAAEAPKHDQPQNILDGVVEIDDDDDDEGATAGNTDEGSAQAPTGSEDALQRIEARLAELEEQDHLRCELEFYNSDQAQAEASEDSLPDSASQQVDAAEGSDTAVADDDPFYSQENYSSALEGNLETEFEAEAGQNFDGYVGCEALAADGAEDFEEIDVAALEADAYGEPAVLSDVYGGEVEEGEKDEDEDENGKEETAMQVAFGGGGGGPHGPGGSGASASGPNNGANHGGGTGGGAEGNPSSSAANHGGKPTGGDNHTSGTSPTEDLDFGRSEAMEEVDWGGDVACDADHHPLSEKAAEEAESCTETRVDPYAGGDTVPNTRDGSAPSEASLAPPRSSNDDDVVIVVEDEEDVGGSFPPAKFGKRPACKKRPWREVVAPTDGREEKPKAKARPKPRLAAEAPAHAGTKSASSLAAASLAATPKPSVAGVATSPGVADLKTKDNDAAKGMQTAARLRAAAGKYRPKAQAATVANAGLSREGLGDLLAEIITKDGGSTFASKVFKVVEKEKPKLLKGYKKIVNDVGGLSAFVRGGSRFKWVVDVEGSAGAVISFAGGGTEEKLGVEASAALPSNATPRPTSASAVVGGGSSSSGSVATADVHPPAAKRARTTQPLMGQLQGRTAPVAYEGAANGKGDPKKRGLASTGARAASGKNGVGARTRLPKDGGAASCYPAVGPTSTSSAVAGPAPRASEKWKPKSAEVARALAAARIARQARRPAHPCSGPTSREKALPQRRRGALHPGQDAVAKRQSVAASRPTSVGTTTASSSKPRNAPRPVPKIALARSARTPQLAVQYPHNTQHQRLQPKQNPVGHVGGPPPPPRPHHGPRLPGHLPPPPPPPADVASAMSTTKPDWLRRVFPERRLAPTIGAKFVGQAPQAPNVPWAHKPVAGESSQSVGPFVDNEGRPIDTTRIVVNFANVGHTYGATVMRLQHNKFCYEGVRRCVKHLVEEIGLNVIGVVYENYGEDKTVPQDIQAMCESIQLTPRLTGMHHRSADDEMTIKCAYRRNCLFLDNDNYRDWLRSLKDEHVRVWLQSCQDMLQMRYYFDSDLGTFDTLDGNIVLKHIPARSGSPST